MTIHLIAAGDLENPNNWPKIWSKCYNIWKSSPYKIKLWGDKDINNLLIEDDEGFFKDYLSNLKPIFKWDYVRPLILKKFGGAYFDMDIEIFFDFLPQLNPNVVYIMGGHKEIDKKNIVENSIMISYPNLYNNQFFHDLQQYFKYNISYLLGIMIFMLGMNYVYKTIRKKEVYKSVNFDNLNGKIKLIGQAIITLLIYKAILI